MTCLELFLSLEKICGRWLDNKWCGLLVSEHWTASAVSLFDLRCLPIHHINYLDNTSDKHDNVFVFVRIYWQLSRGVTSGWAPGILSRDIWTVIKYIRQVSSTAENMFKYAWYLNKHPRDYPRWLILKLMHGRLLKTWILNDEKGHLFPFLKTKRLLMMLARRFLDSAVSFGDTHLYYRYWNQELGWGGRIPRSC